jgi:DNA-directed RNA polymerase subunit RPC12/RpoP
MSNKTDVGCAQCGNIFEIQKKSILEDFSEVLKISKCPKCSSDQLFRIFSNLLFDVADGQYGNSQSGYGKNVVYHPSKFTGKTTTIKIKK